MQYSMFNLGRMRASVLFAARPWWKRPAASKRPQKVEHGIPGRSISCHQIPRDSARQRGCMLPRVSHKTRVWICRDSECNLERICWRVSSA